MFFIQKEYYRSLVDQLKVENSRKSRLQERDDWKALIDSIQADRVRLQEENIMLAQQLEDATQEIADQTELIEKLTQETELIASPSSNSNADSILRSPDTNGVHLSVDTASDLELKRTNSSPRRVPSLESSTPQTAGSSRCLSPDSSSLHRLRLEIEALKEQVFLVLLVKFNNQCGLFLDIDLRIHH